tara:strand:- start:44 stop:1255 length:1212 start_codon:yes stop_codon:yes gene_type:complete
MRIPNLSLPLTVCFALAIALMPVSCGKEKTPKNKGSAKGATAPKGAGAKEGPESQNGNVISGGQIVMIGDIVFKNGEITTPYTGWVIWKHATGKRQMESYCKAGIWNGPSKWWYKNGTLAGEGIYDQGKWEGEYKESYENGQQKVQITFKEGKEEGKEIWWYENGKVRSVTPYRAGKKEGKAQGFFPSGAKNWEAGWAGNSSNGDYTEWHENGDTKSIVRYVKGARHGNEEHWYARLNKSQKQQKEWEVTWFKGKKQGAEKHWYPGSNWMKWMTYEKGVLQGQAASFYENSRQERASIYQNGKETYRKQWDQNGKLVFDGSVGQANKPQGRTHTWTQQSISDHCRGMTTAQIEALFGKTDSAGPGGAWVFRKINFVHQNKPRTATVHFVFNTGKVAQVKITAE